MALAASICSRVGPGMPAVAAEAGGAGAAPRAGGRRCRYCARAAIAITASRTCGSQGAPARRLAQQGDQIVDRAAMVAAHVA